MAVNKKRDFKRLSLCIQEFLTRLPCNENTGFLRDTLYLSLLELHKYYIKEKERLNLGLQQTNETGKLAVVYEHSWKDVCSELDKYDEKWRDCDDGQQFLAHVEGNVDNLKNNILSDNHDTLGRTYLMHAIHGDNTHKLETVEHILSLNFNIDAQAHNGSTALHVACQYQKTSIAALLLKNKASVSLQDKKGRSALHWAASCQTVDLVKLLLQYGGDINTKDCDGMTPAMWACYFNRPDSLHVLRNALERVDPRPEAIFDEQDNLGRTVLHWAAMTRDQNSSLVCLKELLAVDDVSCDIRDNQGRTVLHVAAIQGSVSACEQILSMSNKDVLNLKDNENQTALHLATLCGHGEMVDFLLQKGANSSVENKNERTALQEAEIGHYHYCLLVFATFDRIEDKKESKPLVKNDVEKKNKDKRRYESWVIPSTSLNESHDIPVHGEELVDVTEIKGFEINGEVAASEIIQNLSENTGKKPVPTRENSAATTVERAKTTHNPAATTDEPTAATDKPAATIDSSATTTDVATDKNNKTRRSNKSVLLQRSERVEDMKEVKEQDAKRNTAGNALPSNHGTSLQEEELEGYSSQYLQQHGSASCSSESTNDNYSVSENIEISSLVIESDDEESETHDVKTDEDKIKESQKKHSPRTEQASGASLAPIKPQSNLTLPPKLDPIPKKTVQLRGIVTSQNVQQRGSMTSQNVASRGIVSPLQPPVLANQKEQHGMSLLSRDKLQHPDGRGYGTRGPEHGSRGPDYGTRGPEHGPLAQTHSKELLSSVFKESPSKISEQKTPELQRRSMNPGKLSRPTVRH